ncbi:MAG: peptidylprolyl isomerase [Methanosarcinales archaeon Met12]|nr:MAG: peptidylprolyl isomerase [Methanosarcinales archaeon Met12]
MPIKNGDFIKISYTGRLKNGTVFDTTDGKIAKEAGTFDEKAKYEPQLVVVGAGHAVKGLEEDMVGRDIGYGGSVEVPPEKGFGERNPALIETFSITKFKEKPQPGMQVSIDGRNGVVETAIGRRARVDFNHPLAGILLVYDYVIEEKIDDTKAKIKGLINLYARADLDVEIQGDIAKVIVPYSLSFDQRWIISKRQIADEILAHTDIKEMLYIEKYTKSKKDVAKKSAKKPIKKSAKKSGKKKIR